MLEPVEDAAIHAWRIRQALLACLGAGLRGRVEAVCRAEVAREGVGARSWCRLHGLCSESDATF
eukprot:7191928-Lingulodinium_polyedra.AAC.1